MVGNRGGGGGGRKRLRWRSDDAVHAELHRLGQRNADLLAENSALRRQRAAIERSVQEVTEYVSSLRGEGDRLRDENQRLANELASLGRLRPAAVGSPPALAADAALAEDP
jgi:predicted nuclease with TOPRIM domain